MLSTAAATAKVLVVDDDVSTRLLVRKALGVDDIGVIDCGDAPDAVELIARDEPDLVVLDIGLPGGSGLDVLVRIRERSDVPVVLLTGRADEADRIAGLDLGADDYVVKPFYPGELAARVRSLLRRRGAQTSDVIERGDLRIDRTTREVTVAGTVVELTAKEFDLLTFLARTPRTVYDREQLLRQVWDSSGEWQDSATVTEHVRRIRNKLVALTSTVCIGTVRGIGYRFEVR